MTSVKSHLTALAVSLGLPIIMLLPALLPGRNLLPALMLGNASPWNTLPQFHNPPFNPLQFDGVAQFYPWRLFAARTIRAGFLPLWNPYQFCGTPMLANDQSAVLYPLNLLFVVMPVAKAFAASVVLHLFLTGAFLYAFLRRRLAVAPSLLGGIVWQLSAWQISWLALPTFLCTSAWIPAALLLVDLCVQRPSALRSVLLGSVLGMVLLAGHIQIAVYALVITAAYGVTQLFASPPERRAAISVSYAGAAALSAMMFAPQILPTLELARQSNRAASSGASFAGYQAYIALHMPWFHLVTLFAPSFYGRNSSYWGATNYAENACFVGIGTLMLALVAVIARWKGAEARMVRFFTGVAVLAMLTALGTPVAMALYFGIPGFAQTASPARILVLWALAAAVLAAYGLDSLSLSARSIKPAAWATVGLMVATLAAAVLFVESLPPGYMQRIDRADIAVSVAMTLVVLLAASAATRAGRAARYAPAALIALIVVDLFRAGYLYNRPAPDSTVFPGTAATAFLQHAGGRVLVVNPRNAVYDPREIGVLPPNAATVYGLDDLAGYDSLQTLRYKAWVNRAIDGGLDSSPVENGNVTLTYADGIASNAARLAGVQWIVSGSPLPGLGEPAAPPAPYVYRAPFTALPIVRSAGEQPVVAYEIRPTRLVARAASAGDIVVAQQWYPGWTPSVDGHPWRLNRGPAVFETVPGVPAGASVQLRYEPESFAFGLFLACAGALWAAAVIAAAALRRASRPRTRS